MLRCPTPSSHLPSDSRGRTLEIQWGCPHSLLLVSLKMGVPSVLSDFSGLSDSLPWESLFLIKVAETKGDDKCE